MFDSISIQPAPPSKYFSTFFDDFSFSKHIHITYITYLLFLITFLYKEFLCHFFYIQINQSISHNILLINIFFFYFKRKKRLNRFIKFNFATKKKLCLFNKFVIVYKILYNKIYNQGKFD